MKAFQRSLVLGACLLAAACRKPPPPPPSPMLVEDHGLLRVPEGSPLRRRLVIAEVRADSAAADILAPAEIETVPSLVTNILTPLSGRVTRLGVRLGQTVRSGQMLAELASSDLDQARSDFVKAKDADALARKQSRRSAGVLAAGGGASKDLEAAVSSAAQARAELARARARLADLGADPNGRVLILKAPRAGVVTALNISVGAQVSDPTQTLLTVASVKRIEIVANLSEDEVGAVKVGAPARIVLQDDPGRVLLGRVGETDALLSADVRRQKVRVTLENPQGRLLPGMYATATFDARPRQGAGVAVPQSALLMNNDAITVMVEVRPWTFARRTVVIGDETDAAARVVSGLKGGERVVVRGGVLLDD